MDHTENQKQQMRRERCRRAARAAYLVSKTCFLATLCWLWYGMAAPAIVFGSVAGAAKLSQIWLEQKAGDEDRTWHSSLRQ